MLKRLAPALAALAMAAPAIAGDLPSVKDAPLPPPVVFPYDWTGVYVGADLGGAWSQSQYSVGGLNTNLYGASVMGGGFAGFNRQIGSFVLGIEGDVQGLGIDKSQGLVNVKQNLLAAVNGRLGFAFDHFLVYAIGGVAFSDTRYTDYRGVGNFTNANVGYDVGGGLEYAFMPNWTVRGEYRYYNFGTADSTTLRSVNFGFQQSNNTARVGVAYKFSPPAPAAVVAKY
ncbi:outer membrane beta-barrel protein [Rhodoblastus acidophilus]|jgi:outer membrane immunogenic protein|uniref:Outer membrane beta-barrel protein n=1 Tax=Rhodoblastus acidophilus TaxID=1074 RepID=A0A6N8DJ74_RHOAC|nr:outer membrane protein [Rhodoblastus acidophilus]MCW2273455.1 outer membrane immunogenic protein [Rhodoblastus acidophilus]MTV30459.1 outer membrane beta-barrel protein [Rhodoblastus acidophilus]